MKFGLEEKHVKWGLTVFLVVLCSILVFFAVYRFDGIQKLAGICTDILAPFIYGLIMAYLLCPVYNFTVRNIYGLLTRRRPGFPRALTIAKGVGTVAALITMFIIVVGVMWMILPGLIDSIIRIIEILPGSMDQLMDWLNLKLANYPEAKTMIDSWINRFTDDAISFVTDTLLPEYSTIAVSVSEGLLGILNVLTNVFVAVIICAYFLNSKEIFAAQCKKIILAVCKEKTAREILDGANFTNKTFGEFINGSIIDSFVVGLICFLFMTIFGWEYSLLISCIIAITNLIPFFGPFIGAIPSALLLLMVDPGQCISFLIFILILQQIDGNIISPKILGNRTGISSFWVLFAVLVGGGLFGFVGMVIGIPIFAVIYAYLTRAVNGRLETKGYSTSLSDYKVDGYRVKKKRKDKKNRVNNDDGDKQNKE